METQDGFEFAGRPGVFDHYPGFLVGDFVVRGGDAPVFTVCLARRCIFWRDFLPKLVTAGESPMGIDFCLGSGFFFHRPAACGNDPGAWRPDPSAGLAALFQADQPRKICCRLSERLECRLRLAKVDKQAFENEWQANGTSVLE